MSIYAKSEVFLKNQTTKDFHFQTTKLKHKLQEPGYQYKKGVTTRWSSYGAKITSYEASLWIDGGKEYAGSGKIY